MYWFGSNYFFTLFQQKASYLIWFLDFSPSSNPCKFPLSNFTVAFMYIVIIPVMIYFTFDMMYFVF